VTRMRCLSACLSPNWRALNNPRPPGMAKTMERSSPRNLCHNLTPIRRFPRSSSKMSNNRVARRGGRVMVLSTVSMIHPKTSLIVDHEPSPLRSFLTEIGSSRVESFASGGFHTPSTMCHSRRLIVRRRLLLPWATPMKSSTKTSL
jgi:hypothetical protein